MSHYAKLATLALRLAAVGMIFVGAIGLVFVGLEWITRNPGHGHVERFWSSQFYIIVGILLYILGKPLGLMITSDLSRPENVSPQETPSSMELIDDPIDHP